MRQTTEPETEETMRNETAPGSGRAPRRGFSGYNKTVDSLNRTTLQVKGDPVIIAFLEPENFTFALRHWVKYIDNDGKPQTRAEYCIEEECPVCDIGDKPKAVCFFNVVDLDNPGKVLVWEASADPTDAIQKEYNKLDKRGQRLNNDSYYWLVSKEQGKNGFYSYSVDKITVEDLAADWKNTKPLTSEQRTALAGKLYGEDYVEYKTRQELLDFVDTLG